MLQDGGFEVLEAGDGQEALALLGRPGMRADVVVTDVTMPHMNGIELAERLLVINPSQCIVLMSSYSRAELMRQGLTPPDLPVIHKPIEADVLCRAIHEVLGELLE
jgi:CheY-like chemotaxis protein